MKKFTIGVVALTVLVAAAEIASEIRSTPQGSRSITPPDPILTIIRATGAFEGGFSSVNPNRGTNNGLSFGIIQWTQNSGSLGLVLKTMQAADPAAFAKAFGPSWKQVIDVAVASRDGNIGRTVEGQPLNAEPWLSRFKAAGAVPSLQRAQLQAAHKSDYMRAATNGARRLKLEPTLRVVGVLFDRAVQQGAPTVAKVVEEVAEQIEAEELQNDTGSVEDTDEESLYTPAPRDPEATLRRVIDRLAGMFRRRSAPSAEKDPNKRWKQIRAGEWHKFTGANGTGVDLYADIVRRAEHALTNPDLNDDVLVRLGSTNVAAKELAASFSHCRSSYRQPDLSGFSIGQGFVVGRFRARCKQPHVALGGWNGDTFEVRIRPRDMKPRFVAKCTCEQAFRVTLPPGVGRVRVVVQGDAYAGPSEVQELPLTAPPRAA